MGVITLEWELLNMGGTMWDEMGAITKTFISSHIKGLWFSMTNPIWGYRGPRGDSKSTPPPLKKQKIPPKISPKIPPMRPPQSPPTVPHLLLWLEKSWLAILFCSAALIERQLVLAKNNDWFALPVMTDVAPETSLLFVCQLLQVYQCFTMLGLLGC